MQQPIRIFHFAISTRLQVRTQSPQKTSHPAQTAQAKSLLTYSLVLTRQTSKTKRHVPTPQPGQTPQTGNTPNQFDPFAPSLISFDSSGSSGTNTEPHANIGACNRATVSTQSLYHGLVLYVNKIQHGIQVIRLFVSSQCILFTQDTRIKIQ